MDNSPTNQLADNPFLLSPSLSHLPNVMVYIWAKRSSSGGNSFVHFHKNKFKFLYKHLAVAIVWVWGRSTQWGPGVKPLVRGYWGTKSPWSWSCWWHFAILCTNLLNKCNITVTYRSFQYAAPHRSCGSFAEVYHGIYLLPKVITWRHVACWTVIS